MSSGIALASGQQQISEWGAQLVAALKRQMLEGNPLELPRQWSNDTQTHRGLQASTSVAIQGRKQFVRLAFQVSNCPITGIFLLASINQ